MRYGDCAKTNCARYGIQFRTQHNSKWKFFKKHWKLQQQKAVVLMNILSYSCTGALNTLTKNYSSLRNKWMKRLARVIVTSMEEAWEASVDLEQEGLR